MGGEKGDVVDEIVADWAREKPDLDASGLAVEVRIGNLAAKLEKRADQLLQNYGLAQWSFDVLAALRKTGTPFRLSPKALSQSTMLTSAGMVNRLDRLESRGLLRRLPNPEDRRGVIVELTDEGKELIDRVIPERFNLANALVSEISETEREILDGLLKKVERQV